MYQLTRALVVGLLLAPLPTSAQDRAATGTQIGVVARNLDGQPCLRVADSSLTPGLRLETAAIPVDGWSDISGTAVLEIVSVRPSACAGFPGTFGDTDYLLRIIEGTVFALAGGPSIAVVGGTARLVYRDGTLHTDLDGDGVPETFRGCTSREGIHLTLWSGVPLESERLWHVGFPVGYDVIATCTEADYRER
jgi:hypothetical protein